MGERQEAHDRLLGWCSEIGSGEWAQFRRACEYLRLPAYEALRGLQALGHLEIDWQAGVWACTPAVLVELASLPGRLLLTGARTNGALETLRERVREQEVDADVLGPYPQRGVGPSTVHLEVDPTSYPFLQERLGLTIITDAAERLAALLAPATLEVISAPFIPDERFPAAPIDPDTLRAQWGEPGSPGAAWVQLLPGNRPVWHVRDANGRARRLAAGEWAPYVAQRGEGAVPLVRYDPAHNALVVDAAAPLPALHARTACLCSGRLAYRRHHAPQTADDRWPGVPETIARTIIASLRQPLFESAL